MTKDVRLSRIIDEIFIEADILWVIKKWAPHDEYYMEAGKISFYIEQNPDCSENMIFEELVKIIKEWFWVNVLHPETEKSLSDISQKIFLAKWNIQD